MFTTGSWFRIRGLVRLGSTVISIVDDDESVRLATQSLLSSRGWTAHAFASADEFLNSPRLNDSACLVVDVQMPRINGIDLQRILGARGYSIPMVFITAFPNDNIRERLLNSGAVCFLSKPFDDQSLIQCLDRALQGKSNA
jgi:FixJ family two-component response regulator